MVTGSRRECRSLEKRFHACTMHRFGVQRHADVQVVLGPLEVVSRDLELVSDILVNNLLLLKGHLLN